MGIYGQPRDIGGFISLTRESLERCSGPASGQDVANDGRMDILRGAKGRLVHPALQHPQSGVCLGMPC